jgi:hypothetical protein
MNFISFGFLGLGVRISDGRRVLSTKDVVAKSGFKSKKTGSVLIVPILILCFVCFSFH